MEWKVDGMSAALLQTLVALYTFILFKEMSVHKERANGENQGGTVIIK